MEKVVRYVIEIHPKDGGFTNDLEILPEGTKPEDAELVLTANGWLNIYDDDSLCASLRGDTIELWLLTKGVDKAEITILVK